MQLLKKFKDYNSNNNYQVSDFLKKNKKMNLSNLKKLSIQGSKESDSKGIRLQAVD